MVGRKRDLTAVEGIARRTRDQWYFRECRGPGRLSQSGILDVEHENRLSGQVVPFALLAPGLAKLAGWQLWPMTAKAQNVVCPQLFVVPNCLKTAGKP